jgi:hypothetical protein
MSSLAIDTQSLSPVEQAQARFDQALSRLDGAITSKMAKAPVTSSDDKAMIDVLREEIEDLRQYNSVLNEANKTALSQVEMTIGRLKGMVET